MHVKLTKTCIHVLYAYTFVRTLQELTKFEYFIILVSLHFSIYTKVSIILSKFITEVPSKCAYTSTFIDYFNQQIFTCFFFSVLNILLISLLVLIVADFLWKIRLILATRKFDGPFYVPVIGNAIILYTKQDGKKMDIHGIFH